MTRQPIYVAFAVTSDSEGLMPVCWYTSKQRAGEVGEALAKQDGLAFWGVFGCNHADYQAITSFPDDHPLNFNKPDSEHNNLVTKLIINKVNQLVDYIATLEPGLNEGELAAIVAFLIDGLPWVIKSCQLEKTIHEMAASFKKKRQQSTTATQN